MIAIPPGSATHRADQSRDRGAASPVRANLGVPRDAVGVAMQGWWLAIALLPVLAIALDANSALQALSQALGTRDHGRTVLSRLEDLAVVADARPGQINAGLLVQASCAGALTAVSGLSSGAGCMLADAISRDSLLRSELKPQTIRWLEGAAARACAKSAAVAEAARWRAVMAALGNPLVREPGTQGSTYAPQPQLAQCMEAGVGAARAAAQGSHSSDGQSDASEGCQALLGAARLHGTGDSGAYELLSAAGRCLYSEQRDVEAHAAFSAADSAWGHWQERGGDRRSGPQWARLSAWLWRVPLTAAAPQPLAGAADVEPDAVAGPGVLARGLRGVSAGRLLGDGSPVDELGGRGYGRMVGAWGASLLRAGRPRLAIDRLRAALALDPTDGAAAVNLAGALLSDSKGAAAIYAALRFLGVLEVRALGPSAKQRSGTSPALAALSAAGRWAKFGRACYDDAADAAAGPRRGTCGRTLKAASTAAVAPLPPGLIADPDPLAADSPLAWPGPTVMAWADGEEPVAGVAAHRAATRPAVAAPPGGMAADDIARRHASSCLRNAGVAGVTFSGALRGALAVLWQQCRVELQNGREEECDAALACAASVGSCNAAGLVSQAQSTAGGFTSWGNLSSTATSLVAAGHLFPGVASCGAGAVVGEASSLDGARAEAARQRCLMAALVADERSVGGGCEEAGRTPNQSWAGYWDGVPDAAKREWPPLLAQQLRARRLTGDWQHWGWEQALLRHWLGGTEAEAVAARRELRASLGRPAGPQDRADQSTEARKDPRSLARESLGVFDGLLLPLTAWERLVSAVAMEGARAEPVPLTEGGEAALEQDASLRWPWQDLLSPWSAPGPSLPPPLVSAHRARRFEQRDCWSSAGGVRRAGCGSLRVLYLSHDFAAHPTATLIEAVPWLHSGNAFAEADGNRDNGSSSVAAPFGRLHPREASSQVHSSAIHYGSLDGSRVQRSLSAAFSPMLAMHSRSDDEVAAAARSLLPDVALDMQGATLGGRPGLLARRVARVQALFLILPGTTGSRHVDWFVADKVVAPPELARRFTESLALLPGSYQASSWPQQTRSEVDATLHRTMLGIAASDHGLCRGWVLPRDAEAVSQLAAKDTWALTHSPVEEMARVEAASACADAMMLLPAAGRAGVGLGGAGCRKRLCRPGMVLASFNKLEKLRPETVAAWAGVLRRSHGAMLWLMGPSSARAGPLGRCTAHSEVDTVHRLCLEFSARGVHPGRIVLAHRGHQAAHMLRMGFADVFLDNAGGAYGAHSTATDALRAGLPVLTVGAPLWQMADAVGASLVRELDASAGPAGRFADVLVQPSVRGFQDMGVGLCQRPGVAAALRRRVAKAALRAAAHGSGGLFDAAGYTEGLERLLRAMVEARDTGQTAEGGAVPHVVVGRIGPFGA